ncbi:MAG: GTP-binding protein [Albidovulum sp.]
MSMLKNSHLLSAGNEAVAEQCKAFAALSEKLSKLAKVSDGRTSSRATALKSKLDGYCANVILVGQVKAGKSALTNILAGSPGLLPSDVNPWTSVVTSMQINGEAPRLDGDERVRARFSFFDRDDWNALTTGGGRLGELSSRAGAKEEMVDITRQIEEMREKTERRLGKHFERILGQAHTYGYVDTELMERYVSIGDNDPTDDVSTKTGRFADITKSAELFLTVPEYAMPIRFCDTPGVNDTFMMREQITIRSLRGAELCVVVLAAHQALTTIDLALMRIIANLEKRQIVLFVNRIDELADPMRQIPEIRDSIRKTLKSNRVESDVAIVFGSAQWAEAALKGDRSILMDDSADVLDAYLEAREDLTDLPLDDAMWHASGLPELLIALGERISDGSARHLHEKTLRGTRNLTNQARAVVATTRRDRDETAPVSVLAGDPVEAANDISRRRSEAMTELCDSLRADLIGRMTSAQEGFVKRATESLIDHFEKFGENGTWNYDPAGLRVLHRSAYASFSRQVKAKVGDIYEVTTRELEAVYRGALEDQLQDFRVDAPQTPQIPPPVELGKTLALDLQGNWWRRWWQKRKGFETSANEYAHLIRAETQSIINDLEKTQVVPVLEECRTIFDAFVAEHVETLTRLAESGSAESVNLTQSQAASVDAAAIYTEILKDLEEQAA